MAKRTLPIGEHFSTLVDPRVERTRKHALLDIIVIAILAVICDSDGWDEMARTAPRRLPASRAALSNPRLGRRGGTFRRAIVPSTLPP